MKGGIVWNEISPNANGGTENIMRRIERSMDTALLDQFQIFPSRLRGELDPTRVRIYHAHDTAQDPESKRALGDQGWRRFHRVVFVSNSQMMDFVRQYRIDLNRCVVMRNAIDPVSHSPARGTSPVRLIYTSTPQRGLDVLCDAFERLDDLDVELDVFSSYSIYGWPEADEPFEPLFRRLRDNPRVRTHGARPNIEVREALARSHVFAYPSTWVETSCICLMEAMSAGLACVHPNLGALYETAGALTDMYQFDPDKAAHTDVFVRHLRAAISRVSESSNDELMVRYADRAFGWDGRLREWDAFLRSIADLPRETDAPAADVFTYRIGD